MTRIAMCKLMMRIQRMATVVLQRDWLEILLTVVLELEGDVDMFRIVMVKVTLLVRRTARQDLYLDDAR